MARLERERVRPPLEMKVFNLAWVRSPFRMQKFFKGFLSQNFFRGFLVGKYQYSDSFGGEK